MARCDGIRDVEVHAHHSGSVMAVLAGGLGICILQIVIQIVAFHACIGELDRINGSIGLGSYCSGDDLLPSLQLKKHLYVEYG